VRIAIYGGSFNPPHVGHAMVASWVRWTGRADAVWLLPVYRHAFEDRHDKTLAPYAERVAWCTAMAADLGPGVAVSTVESELPVPSFTVDTLRHLAATHPEHRFRLVVGADVLEQVGAWREWDVIEAVFAPIVVGRQGYPAPTERPSVDFPDVSSSDLRDRLARGVAVDHLVTAGVAALLDLDRARALWGGAA
jgi:nicotinate-nucleotide adenylyltransferase